MTLWGLYYAAEGERWTATTPAARWDAMAWASAAMAVLEPDAPVWRRFAELWMRYAREARTP